MRKLSFAFIPAILATSLFAQSLPPDTCGPQEPVADCFGRFADPKPDVVVTAIVTDVAQANTGAPAVTSPLTSPLASPLKDFLSLFVTSVDMATLSEKNDGALTLDWNFGSQKFTTGRPFKLQAVFNKPQLDPKVKAALGGELLQQQEASLRDTDDATISLSYSPQNRTLGRTLSPHRALIDLLTSRARTGEVEDVKTRELARLLQVFEKEEPFKSNPNPQFGALTAPQKAAMGSAIVSAGAEQVAIAVAYRKMLRDLGVDDFRTLLNQQPQAYASAVQRSRNSLIGADETSFKLTYETSGRGLGSFYKKAQTTCNDTQLEQAQKDSLAGQTESDSIAVKACLDAWQAFRSDPKTKAALASPSRFAFSLEYAGVRRNNVSLKSPPPSVTPDPFTLHRPSSESLIGSVVYGLPLIGNGPGTREGRLDFSASYENVTGDKDRDNRFVASAVYSQKISDMLTMPIGIVYANRDRYLKTFSDRGLSMHFGLVMKMPTFGKLQQLTGGQ